MPSEVGCLQIHRSHIGCEQNGISLAALLSSTSNPYLILTCRKVVLHIYGQLLSVDDSLVLHDSDIRACVALIHLYGKVCVLVNLGIVILSEVLFLRYEADCNDVALFLRSEVEDSALHIVDNLDLLHFL